MPLSYEYDKSVSAVLTKVSGCLTIPETVDYFDLLISDDKIDEPFVEIVNFADTEDFNFGYLESHAILNKIEELSKVKKYLGAVLIADSELAHGMSNMFSSIGECRGIEIVVVTNEEEAFKAMEAIVNKKAC